MSNWFEEASPATRECYCRDKVKGAKKSKHCDCSSGKCVPRAKSLSKVVLPNIEEDEIKQLSKPEGIVVNKDEVYFEEAIQKDLPPSALNTYASLIKFNKHYIYSTSINKIAKSQDKSYTGGIRADLEVLKKKGYIDFTVDGAGVLIKHLKKISASKSVPKEYLTKRTPLESLPKASQQIMKALMASESQELITTTRALAEQTGCSSLTDIKRGLQALKENEYISCIQNSKGTIVSLYKPSK